MSSAGDPSTTAMDPKKSPVSGRRNDTGGRRSGSPAARHEQEMGGAIHELRARGIRLLEPFKFLGKPAIARWSVGIPTGIRHKSTMKQVQTAHIFNVEAVGEMVPQFERCKLVKAERNMSAVAEVDFAPVPDVILLQSADFLDRVRIGVAGAPFGWCDRRDRVGRGEIATWRVSSTARQFVSRWRWFLKGYLHIC
ncbi:MAG: hypothetical protein QOF74_6943 [Caballeronia mineralivorans]|jgi:hypothetical protein|nr:hypothetical protein [Caballeronia mineralivorans]